MKTIIRLLAKISGVEDDIRKEAIEEIGGNLKNESYWFTGLYYGTVVDGLPPIYAALHKIGSSLQENHHYQISTVRDDVVEWISNGEKLDKV